MKIVCLESLGVEQAVLDRHVALLQEQGHEFVAYQRESDVELLKQRVKDADVIMLANMPLKGEVIQSCEHLKFIDVAFTGVDHVDLAAAERMGAKVSNASGYSNQAVAELALGMMLSLLRNMREVEQRCRCGMSKDGLIGNELASRCVGIIGVGAIGSRLAELCHAFGCRILGHKRHIIGNEPDYIEFVSKEELLRESDIVSLHTPLNDSTYHLIGEAELALMKDTAILINTARGNVVDQQALIQALKQKKIAMAGIDVFDLEPPLPLDHPLLSCENLLLTPHVAFATKQSMELRADIVFDNLQAFLKGNQQNIVL